MPDVRYAGKKRDPFYISRPWRRARKKVLERDHYWCQCCKRRYANTVHHIIPRKERPDLALEESNLESVCSFCHNVDHPERNRKKGPGGKARPAPEGIRIAQV